MGLEPTKVQVTGDGRQVQEPPQGSYAAMQLEQQRAQAQAQRADLQPPAPPPAQAPDEQLQTAEATQQPAGSPTPEPVESERARHRIVELANARRDAERRAQEAEQRASAREQELQRLQQERDALAAQHHQLVEQHLDDLPVEQRIAFMQEGRTRQLLAEQEQRIMARLEKPIGEVREAARQRELSSVADKYPGFDADTHMPLIRAFQERNPACTVEQAFRAVAEDGELRTDPVQRTRQVPPIPAPRTTRGDTNYVPPPTAGQKTEDQILIEESDEIARLGKSLDPQDRRKQRDLLDRHLARRYQGRFSARK